jgi:hypothetical protein
MQIRDSPWELLLANSGMKYIFDIPDSEIATIGRGSEHNSCSRADIYPASIHVLEECRLKWSDGGPTGKYIDLAIQVNHETNTESSFFIKSSVRRF